MLKYLAKSSRSYMKAQTFKQPHGRNTKLKPIVQSSSPFLLPTEERRGEERRDFVTIRRQSSRWTTEPAS
jgi:hypothetical protein